MLVHAWHKSYGLPISISNCSNNYGKYQDNSKLIPKVINHCLKEEIIPIHGSGEYIRDWIHVEDHCRGILAILENLEKTNNEIFLFGG
jgi:dTDP-glucose 4,6-dehydratase